MTNKCKCLIIKWIFLEPQIWQTFIFFEWKIHVSGQLLWQMCVKINMTSNIDSRCEWIILLYLPQWKLMKVKFNFYKIFLSLLSLTLCTVYITFPCRLVCTYIRVVVEMCSLITSLYNICVVFMLDIMLHTENFILDGTDLFKIKIHHC